VLAKPRYNGAAFAVAVLFCAAAWQLLPWCPGVGPAPAEAQRARPRPQKSDQYEITSKSAEAMRYLSTDPQRSLDILRSLDRQFPHNDRVLFRLGYTFQVMGTTDSAAVYYRRALRLNPQSIEAGKSLGALYLSEERRDDAIIVFDRLLSANNYSVSAYKAVGNSLRELGQYEEALAIFSEGRNRSKQHFALTLDIADLHRSARQYKLALDEYLRYVDARRGNYRFTRDRVMEMMRDVGDAERIRLIEALDDRLESGAGNRYVTLDILAAMYLEQGLLEQALDKAIEADGEKESEGTVLLTLADQIITTAEVKPREERRRYLDLGIRALDAFATNHPTAAGTDRAKYMLATIYVRFGSGKVPGVTPAETDGWIEKAIQEYTELAKRYPGSEYAERANLERGDLLLHKMKQPRKALEAYKVGAVNSRRYGDVFAARIADVYLGTGAYGDAEHYFVSLEGSGVYELAQTGMYYTGLLLAFRGEYEAARDTLSALAEDDPASPYTNDAIAAAWLIEEGLQFGSESLDAFMSARQSEMLGDTTAVISKLQGIAAGPVLDTLRPRALFKLGRTLYDSGDLDGALRRYNQFLKEYPDNPLRPDVQRSIAAVYEFGYEEYTKALREYEVVLMLYPDYAFLDEVRKDIRRLRFIVEGEE
jgi:tetratricopeptide (TPR) repeat protein